MGLRLRHERAGFEGDQDLHLPQVSEALHRQRHCRSQRPGGGSEVHGGEHTRTQGREKVIQEEGCRCSGGEGRGEGGGSGSKQESQEG